LKAEAKNSLYQTSGDEHTDQEEYRQDIQGGWLSNSGDSIK